MSENPDSPSRYDYVLPEELIAQEPPPTRGASRLLVVDRRLGTTSDARIGDFPALLRGGDVLVLNDTKVLNARMEARRTDTGGRIEIFFLDVGDGEAEALVQARGRLPEGVEAVVSDGDLARTFRLGPPGADGGVRKVATGLTADDLRALLARRGRTPLPPYIRRSKGVDPRDAADAERYQTVFAASPGAVAAPTAGLHLTADHLAEIAARGVRVATVTLHVGLGTFRPVVAEDLDRHVMHAERYVVAPEAADAINAARAGGGRIVAVGTTAVRTLETAATPDGRVVPGAGSTAIFLRPPYVFRATDALLTNFHVPKSTLLMLVAAFLGRERTLAAYAAATERRYRFLSYGDAMFVA